MFRRRYAYADGGPATTTTAGPGAASSARYGLARAIRLITSLVVLVIVVGIVLLLLKANPGNQVVSAIHDAAAWLAGPFKGLVHLSKARTETAVNWGIAALVYFVVGHVLARFIAPRY
jgi:hypothetical protein